MMNKRHKDDIKLNETSVEPGSLKEILLGKRFFDIRLLIVLTSLITLLTWIKNSLSISCQLIFLQNVFLVFIITTKILSRLNIHELRERIKSGAIIGGGVGAAYTTVMFITEDIHYYFMGGRDDISTALGKPVLPVNFYFIRNELCTGLWFCLFLITLSAFIGFFAGMISLRRRIK